MSEPLIHPVGEHILVQRDKPHERLLGGLIIPDHRSDEPRPATIVALGRGNKQKDGSFAAFDVKVGDTVLVAGDGGAEVILNERKYSVIREDDILGILV